MKKIIALVLVLVSVFALCACGEPQIIEKEVEVPVIPEEYKDLIDAIEAGDYAGAYAIIKEMEPAPAETVVNITPENFWDYYEAVYEENYLTKDASGKITEVFPRVMFSLQLKEGINIDYQRSNIEIGVTCDHKLHKIESVDWNTGKITVSQETFDDIANIISKEHSDNQLTTSTTSSGNYSFWINFSYVVQYPCYSWQNGYWSNAYNPTPGDNSEYYLFDIQNFTIVRADGTLVIIN